MELTYTSYDYMFDCLRRMVSDPDYGITAMVSQDAHDPRTRRISIAITRKDNGEYLIAKSFERDIRTLSMCADRWDFVRRHDVKLKWVNKQLVDLKSWK